MPRPWTVLPHQPIEKLQENLWTVEASLPQGPLRRRMGIARLGDGQLVFLNAIALDEASMKQIEAWGKPAFALTANGFHRLDLGSYKVRYPGLRVLAAPAARKRIGQIATVDGWLELLPADPGVSIEEVAGAKMGDVACTAHAARRSSLCFPGHVLMNVAPVPGVEAHVVGKLRHALEALEHLLRIAPRQIASAAGVDEYRVAREETLACMPAGRPRRMTGRVHRRDPHRAHFHWVTGVEWRHLPPQLRREPGNVGAGGADPDPTLGEHFRKTVHVVEVMVREQRVGDRPPVLFRGPQPGRHVPGRIDDRGLAGPLRAHQVDEVLHRPELELPDVERHHQPPRFVSTTISLRCARVFG